MNDVIACTVCILSIRKTLALPMQMRVRQCKPGELPIEDRYYGRHKDGILRTINTMQHCLTSKIILSIVAPGYRKVKSK